MSGYPGSRAESTHYRLYEFAKTALVKIFVHPYVIVCDLYCGGGADVEKWDGAQISHYIGIDVLSSGIGEVREAWESQRKHFTSEFFEADPCIDNLEAQLQDKAIQADLVCCLQHLQLGFETEEKARRLLNNVSSLLKPGGYFFGTTPDSSTIWAKYQKNVEAYHNKSSSMKPNIVPNCIRSDSYMITFEIEEEKFPLFGKKYQLKFSSDASAETHCLVHFPSLIRLAREAGLEYVEIQNLTEFYDDNRLRKAAEEGDTNALYECIEQDPNVLRSFDDYDFVDTPLHIAAAGGHADFTTAILNLKPSFARKLNQEVYSPIHLALQNGHENTVVRLLEADKDLVHVKGKQGYTVLHQAAERGNLPLLAEFLKNCPSGIEDVTIRNETALHIAAKNNRFEAFELLARWLQRSHLYSKVSRKHLLNSKDTYGNTVLHVAASATQPQMIKILVECGADRKATNMNAKTALEIIQENQRTNAQDKVMCLKILQWGDLRILCHEISFSFSVIGCRPRRIKPLHELLRSKISIWERLIMGTKLPLLNLSADRINVLLVVLALILTATFQAAHSPPGGVWQGDAGKAPSIYSTQTAVPPNGFWQRDDSQTNSTDADYTYIGASVLSPWNFYSFMALNLSVFAVASIFTIVLLEFVAAGSFIMILFEILLSSFTCCFLFAVLVLDPSSYVQITARLFPLYFSIIFTAMEIGRRLPFRYQDLMSCFRDSN